MQHRSIEEVTELLLSQLPEEQRPETRSQPQESANLTAELDRLTLDRVADDYDLAIALGHDPKKLSYSETDACTSKHLAKLARQEI